MNIQITGQGIDVSPALREIAEKKLQRIQGHIDQIISIHVTFHVNKIRQMADAQVNVPGSVINASAESEDMYKTVDLLVKKLMVQLTKHKEKITEHH